jgi:hypothetical protein
MSIKKLNLDVLKGLANTFATLHYTADYKSVKKARAANEILTKFIEDNGEHVAEVGTPCPFARITKRSTYTISMGGSLKYKRKAELLIGRNGVNAEYHTEKRDLGMFPIYGEMIWVKNDLSEVYIRCYQASMPKPSYYINGNEVNKAKFIQWGTNDDFKSASGLEKNTSVVADINGDIIYAQDEDGNVILDSNGEPKTIPLPPIRAIKLSNCSIFRKGVDLTKEIFTDEDWDVADLIKIRDEFQARLAKEA